MAPLGVSMSRWVTASSADICFNDLKPDGRLVFMDSRIPSGVMGRLSRPWLTWVSKRTVLGNPDVDILEDLRQLAGDVEEEYLFLGTYFIGKATKGL